MSNPPQVSTLLSRPRARRGGLMQRRLGTMRARAMLYTLIVVTAGAIAGWVWHALVSLPTYLTSDDGSVQITERAQGQIFAIDAVYVIIGLIAGVGLGVGAWNLFRRLGWPVAIIAVLGGLGSGALCWAVGVAQGPRDFAARVAAAQPGEKVPIDFQLHTASALLVWALGAIIPVMLYANLSRDEGPVLGRRRAALAGDVREAGAEHVGQVVGVDLDRQTPTSA